jgi:endoribonuclease Dicer
MSSNDIPRYYQIELFNKAKAGNVIAVLDTGSGKTLISLLLLKHEQNNNLGKTALFLVPTVPLVSQQASYLGSHSDLNIGQLWGNNQSHTL